MIGLLTDQDLQNIKSNNWLATCFMNRKTFSQKEIKVYPYEKRKTYLVDIDTSEEYIEIYATDAKNAREYVTKEYNGNIVEMYEKAVTFTKVN